MAVEGIAAKVRGGGDLERGQGDQPNGQPEHHFKASVGDTLDLRRGHEVDDQCDYGLGHKVAAPDSKPANLDQAGEFRHGANQ